MVTAQLSRVEEIELDEARGAERLSALIHFLRGEISLNKLQVKMGKDLPAQLVRLCDSSGYMPKLTQDALGKMLGCTYAAVQTWEGGKKPSIPRLVTYMKIGILCNLKVNQLTDLLFDYSDELVNGNTFETLALTCEGKVQSSPDEFEYLLDDLIANKLPK